MGEPEEKYIFQIFEIKIYKYLRDIQQFYVLKIFLLTIESSNLYLHLFLLFHMFFDI